MRGASLAILLCACSSRPAVPILTHHSVSHGGDDFAVSPENFAAELDALVRAGFRTISFHDWLDGKPLPPHPVILTFDDGYEDAYTTVLPALRAREMMGTFFVVPEWIGEDEAHRVVHHDDGRTSRYLVWSEVSALSAAGMEIGSHGERHLRLSALSGRELREEVVLSRMAIEAHLHRPVEVFAYPFNSSRARLRSAVRDAGYRAAVSGPAHGSADRFELFRSGVYARTTVEEVLREATR